jgi:hypothetical protein
MKKHIHAILLFILLTSLLAGCAFMHVKSSQCPMVELVPHQWLQLPPPAQMKFNFLATQILTANYKIQQKKYTYTSQVQIDANSKRLIILAIAGWGGEVFSINYDGARVLTNSSPMPHADMNVEHVLVDFILTYASLDVLNSLLQTTAIKIVAKPQQRIFLLYNKPIIKIDYNDTDPWRGRIVLQNIFYHYRLTISTVKLKPN